MMGGMEASTAGNMLSRRRWLGAGVFLLLNLILLVTFADRDGYEGDDLNSILPMAHLGAAKAGLLLIYRYAWQPLSYEYGAALWRLSGTPTAIFLSAPVSGALALTGLLVLAWHEHRGRQGFLIALIALLCVPEFWFSSLYYNSTIVGLPFAVAALMLCRMCETFAAAFVAGLAMSIAILMRVDFILACPLLAVAAWMKTRSLSRAAALAAAILLGLMIGWAAGLIDWHALAAIQAESAAEIKAKAHMPGWDLRTKSEVASISLSPIGWLLLIVGGALLVMRKLKQGERVWILWPLAALPMIYPLLNILSPKYMLPLGIFLPLLFVHCLTVCRQALAGASAAAARWSNAAVALLAFLPILFSASLSGHAPFVTPGLLPKRPIGTHDGQRGYGGYLWQIIAIDDACAKSLQQRQALRLFAEFMTQNGPSLVIAGGENFFDRGAIGWRHLQLLLERHQVHGTLTGPHRIRFQHGSKTLLLTTVPPAPLPAGTRLLDLQSGAAGSGEEG